MRTRYRTTVLAALSLLVVVGVGCSTVKAKAAFKDGNKLYKEENYRKAIAEYEMAVALKPGLRRGALLPRELPPVAVPSRQGRGREQDAPRQGRRALREVAGDEQERQPAAPAAAASNSLAALTAIYAEPPQQNYEKALGYAEQLVKDNPNDTKNLYAMANLYEKFGRVNEAEQTYEKAAQLNPNDPKACGTLASFYNKALWDEQGSAWVEGQSKGARRVKFDKAVGTLERCADLDLTDPKGHNTLAMFYWDKAYRDPLLSDATKNEYADKGLVAVDEALKVNPGYWEAIVSKGLLYRVKAQFAKNPADRKKYLDQAQLLQKQAMDLRKEQQAAQAGGAEPAAPAPDAAAAPARRHRDRGRRAASRGPGPALSPPRRGSARLAALRADQGAVAGPLPRTRTCLCSRVPAVAVADCSNRVEPYRLVYPDREEVNDADGRPLHRSRRTRCSAGCAEGFADWLGWSPTVVRILYVIVSICSVAFPGTIVYLVLWLVMPLSRE